MIFLGKRYLAVWDNDIEGRTRLQKAEKLFGEIEAKKFLTLDQLKECTSTRLEEYYVEKELARYNTEINGKPQSFEKTILSLFYSTLKDKHVKEYFPETTKNFVNMEKVFISKLKEQILEVG